MSTRESYNHWSSTYDSDANLTRDLDAGITKETLGNLRFGSILELGCGTGKNTVFLSHIAGTVLAVDFSVGMLKMARQKVTFSRVAFCVADITAPWPFQAACADLVTCSLVLEHIEDLSQVFAQAARALTQGGHLFINELHPFRQYQGRKARFENGQATIEINAFVHHISDFLDAAESHGFALERFRECWHAQDQAQLPRLASFLFRSHKA